MATQRFELPVEPRTIGKSFSRKLRRERKVPAVIYGSTEPKNVFLDERAVVKYNTSAFENALFNIKSSDKALANTVVLMKDVQVNPLSRRPDHVDLFALDLTKTVRIWVEIKVEGKPIGIADGGLLNVVTRQVEVECLPTVIPSHFVLDVSSLGVGDSLHVSDVNLPQGVKLISSPELTVAVVNLFVEEAVAAPTAEAAPAAGAAAGGAAAPAAGAAAPAAGKKEEKK